MPRYGRRAYRRRGVSKRSYRTSRRPKGLGMFNKYKAAKTRYVRASAGKLINQLGRISDMLSKGKK